MSQAVLQRSRKKYHAAHQIAKHHFFFQEFNIQFLNHFAYANIILSISSSQRNSSPINKSTSPIKPQSQLSSHWRNFLPDESSFLNVVSCFVQMTTHTAIPLPVTITTITKSNQQSYYLKSFKIGGFTMILDRKIRNFRVRNGHNREALRHFL